MTTSVQPYHHGNLRETLLRAAERMIDADASRGFSLRELAREADVSHAAPYKHFRDRGELVLVLAERWMGEFVAEQSAAVGSGDARQDLLALGAAYVRYARTRPSRFLTIFDPAVARPGNPPTPEFAELVRVHSALLHDTVTAAVRAGVVGGAGARAGAVAAALWSQAHGLATLALLGYLPGADAEAVLAALLH
ncbi:TetR/AcrR family transcriptional regulator [Paenibacillus sp. TRM 82003]|uniref:TetR/AcrR family transcriptional regulator n=1 Tax=Kineococcus sp. TRM81007 TaxID=2925831 RepID=UPI001F57CECF|nr:TetR/AcrR family transcriptional regulator [Kineococcus sp. TRM81007]MCI2237677.1 TetR/AcrR family transcriptional regulator [Kineococcus sp. TRM81007]MCI3921695.1 TetR/AcrR family transcriptional regulator [Paenibacillus sp. TRM 82003]